MYFRFVQKINMKDLFEQAVKDVELLKDRPSNDTLLQLYSFYKQATEGDNLNEPPENPFDFVKKAKFEAWASLKGKTPEEAMKDYIELVEKLKV